MENNSERSFNFEKAIDIDLNEIQELQLSNFFVFFDRKHKDPLLLKRPGEFIHSQDLEKFKKYSHLKFIPLSQRSDEFKRLLLKLKSSEDEWDRIQTSSEILSLFSKVYWGSQSEYCLYDFVYACFENFNQFEKKQIEFLDLYDQDFLKRSMCLSALSVVFLIAQNHTSFQFLSDVYHMSFLFERGLLNNHFCTFTKEALEQDRLISGEGENYLEVNALYPKVKEVYKNHHFFNFFEDENKFYERFNQSQRLSFVQLTPEDGRGEDTPLGLGAGDLLSWEKSLLLLNKIIPYQKYEFDFNDYGFYKECFEKAKDKNLFEQISAEQELNNFLNEVNLLERSEHPEEMASGE